MTRNKLDKLSREAAALRRSPQTCATLEKFARKLGRKKLKGSKTRGKEPTWMNVEFPHLRPLTIPHHGGGGSVATGTKNQILNALDDDLMAWEEKLASEEAQHGK